MNEEPHKDILRKYSNIRSLIENKTHTEGEYRVICYTQIITDIPGFQKELEQCEIEKLEEAVDLLKSVVNELKGLG